MIADAIRLIKESLKTKNPYLELGRCGLRDEDIKRDTEFDYLLGQCIHLEAIIVSNEWDVYSGYMQKKSKIAAIKISQAFIPRS